VYVVTNISYYIQGIVSQKISKTIEIKRTLNGSFEEPAAINNA
jgi:hypothetical protein